MILEGEEVRDRGKHWCEREILIGYLPCAPPQELKPQPRYVPRPGTTLQPFGVWDNTPTSWATWLGPYRLTSSWDFCLLVFAFSLPAMDCSAANQVPHAVFPACPAFCQSLFLPGPPLPSSISLSHFSWPTRQPEPDKLQLRPPLCTGHACE